MMPLTQMNTHLMCPKYFPNMLGVPFLSMFNLPFSKAAGNTMKIAQVVPIHKKNSTLLKGNYRPVSTF